MTESSQRINLLLQLLGGRRYLEIGVHAGDTFLGVAAAERTGVDPAFAFDITGFVNANTRLIQQSSDAFFAGEPLDPPYDVIFIDGLHQFEQVMRDFTNALMRTHRASVILIDDVFRTTPIQPCPTKKRRSGTGLPPASRMRHGMATSTK
jgi:predicted O-methyltransferase YrrM